MADHEERCEALVEAQRKTGIALMIVGLTAFLLSLILMPAFFVSDISNPAPSGGELTEDEKREIQEAAESWEGPMDWTGDVDTLSELYTFDYFVQNMMWMVLGGLPVIGLLTILMGRWMLKDAGRRELLLNDDFE